MTSHSTRSQHAHAQNMNVKIPKSQHRSFLVCLTSEAMKERGYEPEFSKAAMTAANAVPDTSLSAAGDVRDARSLPWRAIENDDSRDLDQPTVAEARDDGRICVLVAIADVSSKVEIGSELDRHVRTNTTSIYTPHMKPTEQLHDVGPSLWLDNITRDLLNDGTHKHYIDVLATRLHDEGERPL